MNTNITKGATRRAAIAAMLGAAATVTMFGTTAVAHAEKVPTNMENVATYQGCIHDAHAAWGDRPMAETRAAAIVVACCVAVGGVMDASGEAYEIPMDGEQDQSPPVRPGRIPVSDTRPGAPDEADQSGTTNPGRHTQTDTRPGRPVRADAPNSPTTPSGVDPDGVHTGGGSSPAGGSASIG